MKKFFSLAVLIYLRTLTKIQLLKNKPLIIGITGTAGKTSTRNAIAAVLQQNFKLKVSYKANSESGLPLNILGLSLENYDWKNWLRVILLAPTKLLTNWENYEIYVAEMAIDSPFPPKNMDYLLTILQPQIGVFLNAQPLHSLQFDQIVDEQDPEKRRTKITQAIAAEKGEMIQSLPETGLAVLNQDDPNVIPFKNKTSAKVKTFGRSQKADVTVTTVNPSLKGTVIKLKINQRMMKLNLKNYLLPAHYGHTLAAAVVVGLNLGLKQHQIKNSLEQNFKLAPGRSSLIKGKNNSLILDSSYNASANPVIDALDMINQLGPNRKLALLGDLRELGQEAALEHQRVAKKAAQVCDLMCLVGPQMKKFVLPILKQKQKVNKNFKVEWFESTIAATKFLKDHLQPRDMLLIKGSQNTLLLEIAVEKLMADPDKAEKLLCRRGPYWEQRRSALIKRN